MRQICKCQVPRIRLSRLRLSDLWRLLAFGYPVRCRRCNTRGYTDLLQAIRIRRHFKQSSEVRW
jgi:hypothetical protein